MIKVGEVDVVDMKTPVAVNLFWVHGNQERYCRSTNELGEGQALWFLGSVDQQMFVSFQPGCENRLHKTVKFNQEYSVSS